MPLLLTPPPTSYDIMASLDTVKCIGTNVFAGSYAIVTCGTRQARKGAAAAELSMCASNPAFFY